MVSWLPQPPPQEFTPIPAHPPPSWPPQKNQKSSLNCIPKAPQPPKRTNHAYRRPFLAHCSHFRGRGSNHDPSQRQTPYPNRETTDPASTEWNPSSWNRFSTRLFLSFLSWKKKKHFLSLFIHFNLSSIFPLAVPHHCLAFRKFSYVAFTLLERQNKKTYSHLKHTSALTYVGITVIWWVRGQIYSWICMTSQGGDVTNMFISNSLTC